ncbi:TPA: AlpA family phage regulatory protein [Enterobacter kobei]|uniref:helix-turn-helix transcriptional regulator n=1 Tax=Gammaproteobacteria TaxID=1236 RepID=UPI0009C2D97D|nr:AlpA family phage regulatory protein [Enterobacter roggenkampii]AQT88155.1 transcriptional regulator [Enterobacter roggenkampii]UER60858.1 AlpA family phage regulatory protein [Enterobacter roggenkampii]SSH14642.1 transcriptional regulator AlpA family [Klebsiella pneumoniae]HEG2050542.1 AlpA family phage regulatory protein [Enterobacter kobei]
MHHQNKTLIDKKALLEMIPLAERAIDRLEKEGQFPRRMALTNYKVAWDLAEVEAWIESRRGSKAHRPGGN